MTIRQEAAEIRKRWWSEMGDTGSFGVGTKPVTISVGQSQAWCLDIETFGPGWLSTNNPQTAFHIAAGRAPVKATRRGLWLHSTKGWRGKVRHPKRGRARPTAFGRQEKMR